MPSLGLFTLFTLLIYWKHVFQPRLGAIVKMCIQVYQPTAGYIYHISFLLAKTYCRSPLLLQLNIKLYFLKIHMNYTFIETLKPIKGIMTSSTESEAGHVWETFLPPSNQKLFAAIKPRVKRLSLWELAIILSPLFSIWVFNSHKMMITHQTDSSEPSLPKTWAILKNIHFSRILFTPKTLKVYLYFNQSKIIITCIFGFYSLLFCLVLKPQLYYWFCAKKKKYMKFRISLTSEQNFYKT